MEWSSLKGRGPRWFTVRKTSALQRCHLSQSLLMWFCWCYCFLFFIALLLLSLHIFPFTGFFFGFFKLFVTSFFFMVALFVFEGTFLSWALIFLAVSLAFSSWWLVLAFRRAPMSSDWFFVWHSLRPSSTQLLVHNHSGFCSHWYLAGLLFLLSTSFYRLCFSLPPYFSFKWFFLVVCRVLFSLLLFS